LNGAIREVNYLAVTDSCANRASVQEGIRRRPEIRARPAVENSKKPQPPV
jgi:hypothetical protein